jgi:TonB family protein
VRTSILLSVLFHGIVGFGLFYNWSSNAWNSVPDRTYAVKISAGSTKKQRPQQMPPAAVMRMSSGSNYVAVEPVPVQPGHTAAKLDSLALVPPSEGYYDGGEGGGTGTGMASYMPPPAETATEFHAFDEAPVLLRAQSPRYPDLARQAGIEGTVLLNVLVDEDGKVGDVSIIQSDVTSAMEKAAIEAAKGFFFKPAKQRTVPVRAHIAVPIRFKLHGN